MINTLTVLLYGETVGILNLDDDGICSFQYTPEFCAKGLSPAPIMMPPIPDRIYRFPLLDRNTFSGLPGMIADSLPDSFGQALLDQWLTAQGRSFGEANAIEKLSFQGKFANLRSASTYIEYRILQLGSCKLTCQII